MFQSIRKHSVCYLSNENIFKTPPEKYISASITICDDVNILRFR